MNVLNPFLLSAFIPGAGQLYCKEYLKGLILLIIPSIFLSIFSAEYFIYAYFVSVTISLIDLYIVIKNKVGKFIARKNLFFALAIILIIIPSTAYLLFYSFQKGSVISKDLYLNEKHTKQEMNEVSITIDRYYSNTNKYPKEYSAFVNQRPTTAHWSHDKWGNAYKFELIENGYRLVSAGSDQSFGTEDDLIKSKE